MFRCLYVSTILFIAAFPERMKESLCPETLLLDLARIRELQGLFNEMTAVSGRYKFCLNFDNYRV